MSKAKLLLGLIRESHGFGFGFPGYDPSNPLATTADLGQVVDTDEELEIEEVIQHKGSVWLLKSKHTGKVLGRHPTKEKALAQERAIKANQAARG